LTWANLDLDTKEVIFVTGKTGRRMRIPMADSLHEAGVPAAVAQTMVGHDSEEIYQVYISVGDKAMPEAAAKMPKL